MTRSKTAEGTQAYFDDYVFGVADYDEYLARVGGKARMLELEKIEQLRA